MSDLPFSANVGRRIRALRDEYGMTADEIAATARLLGFGWQRSTVASVETGRRGLSAEEILALPYIFSRAGREEITLEDLIRDGGQLASNLIIGPRNVHELLAGERLTMPGMPRTGKRLQKWLEATTGIDLSEEALRASAAESAIVRHLLPDAYPSPGGFMEYQMVQRLNRLAAGEAEQKAARSLETTPRVISAAAISLWNRGLTEERDRRARRGRSPEGESAAAARTRRGRVTRELLAEIRARLADATKENQDG